MEWNWRNDITREKLVELYVNQKKSMREIGKLFHCPRETIRRHLRRHDIQANYDHRDCLETKYWSPTKEQDECIFGMILGDGSLGLMGHNSARLTFAHSIAQKDYFIWKADLLKPIFSENSVNEYSYRRSSGTTTHSIVGGTRSTVYFGRLRKIFYQNGKKVVTNDILSMISPKALAIWFMDDGCCKRLGLELATCCFSYDEHCLMRRWFMEKYSIRPIIRKSGKAFVLFFNKVNSVKFINLVSPYIHESLSYKIKLSVTPQRLHVGLLREEMMIQSELHGNMKKQAEMTCSPAI